jgi:hypothetical protein
MALLPKSGSAHINTTRTRENACTQSFMASTIVEVGATVLFPMPIVAVATRTNCWHSCAYDT